jgi:hypothetical protein
MDRRILFFQLFQEIIWWLITAWACWVVIYPIEQKIHFNYRSENLLFVVVGITSIRYFIFFNSLFFLKNDWVKFIFFTLNWALWVYILNRYEMLLQLHEMYDLQYFGAMKQVLSSDEQNKVLGYLYREVLLSGLVALVGIPLLNLRFIGAYWQVAKRKFSIRMQE